MMIKQLICILLLTFSFAVSASDEKMPTPFQPSENVMLEVDETLALAKANNKLALFVMGANWCHDSQGLVKRLQDGAIAKTVEKSYQTLLVDVGYLNTGFEVNKRFGMPVIYATPTVMIIDPISERLINAENMHQWASADSISFEETNLYFEGMAKEKYRTVELPSEALAELLAEIDSYENEQSKRIYNSYKVLGPMIKNKAEEKVVDEKFMPYWVQLRAMRSALPLDLIELRKQAIELTAAGKKDIKLNYPSYDAFDWEL